MEYQTIKIEKRAAVCILSLARPDKRNAITGTMRKEIEEALENMAADPEIKVVILTGEGKSFCSGRDVDEVKGAGTLPMHEVYADYLEAKKLTDALREFKKPLIASIQGHAMGMGCCMTTFCDLAVAGESASFGFPEIRLGIVPGISSVILGKMVNRRMLYELILLGDKYDADQALTMGLINKVVPDTQVLEQALEWAIKLAACDSTMLMLTKNWLTTLGEGSYEQEASNSLNLMSVGFVNKNKR